MNSRKILIVAIAALLIIVCIGLYFLLFAPRGTTGGSTTQTGSSGSLPNAGNQSNPGAAAAGGATATSLAKSFGMISNEPVLDYVVNAANTVTAIEPTGKIIQVTNGQVSTLSALSVQNILGASFSYNGARILVSSGDPANPQASIFNIASSTWTPLPAGLQSPTWSPSDYRIAYYTVNASQGTETFATIDASKAKPVPAALITLHAQDLAIAWPAKNQLVFSTKPSAYAPGSAWSFNPQTSVLTPQAIETPGLAILWSGPAFAPAAPIALEFSGGAAGLGGSVALTNAAGNILQRLTFLTLPSKCLFASAVAGTTTSSTPYLYCGVPRDSDTLSISHLPDDYDQMALFTSDDLYRVNLQSGAIDPVFNDPSQNVDVSDVKFSNGTLFFVNRYDGKLYGIQLASGNS